MRVCLGSFLQFNKTNGKFQLQPTKEEEEMEEDGELPSILVLLLCQEPVHPHYHPSPTFPNGGGLKMDNKVPEAKLSTIEPWVCSVYAQDTSPKLRVMEAPTPV